MKHTFLTKWLIFKSYESLERHVLFKRMLIRFVALVGYLYILEKLFQISMSALVLRARMAARAMTLSTLTRVYVLLAILDGTVKLVS